MLNFLLFSYSWMSDCHMFYYTCVNSYFYEWKMQSIMGRNCLILVTSSHHQMLQVKNFFQESWNCVTFWLISHELHIRSACNFSMHQILISYIDKSNINLNRWIDPDLLIKRHIDNSYGNNSSTNAVCSL